MSASSFPCQVHGFGAGVGWKGDLGLATEEMMKGKGARCMDMETLNTYNLLSIFRSSSEGDMDNPARSVGGGKKPAKMIDTARPCTITRPTTFELLSHPAQIGKHSPARGSVLCRINPFVANNNPNDTGEHR